MQITLVTFTILLACALAQVSRPGTPRSFKIKELAETPVYKTGHVDAYAMMEEDEMNRVSDVKLPYRFGYPFFVNITTDNSGVWQVEKAGKYRLWRLAIKCDHAYSINLVFSRYRLPPGASLYVYTPDFKTTLGAFTEDNNKNDYLMAIQPISGTELVIEYNELIDTAFKGEIAISTIVHAYRPVFSQLTRGPSEFCNINVACPEADDWQDQSQAVALITTGSGNAVCTGSILHNTKKDFKPLFLTANHCLGNPSTWVYVFNYQSPTCDGDIGQKTDSIQGGTLLARGAASDFALVELSEAIPKSYNVFFAGWSAVNVPAVSTVGISHPSGDIKKIAVNKDRVTSSQWSGQYRDTHWRVNFWDDGTTEPGSSGSALFDQDGRVVGQLHGGAASCYRIDYDVYGKISYSWAAGSSDADRLDVWLDPENTGTTVFDGEYQP